MMTLLVQCYTSDGDSIYQEVVVTETTSSTTGDIFASNITAGNQYTVYWFVFNLDMYTDAMNANPSLTAEDALNLSLIDEDYFQLHININFGFLAGFMG